MAAFSESPLRAGYRPATLVRAPAVRYLDDQILATPGDAACWEGAAGRRLEARGDALPVGRDTKIGVMLSPSRERRGI